MDLAFYINKYIYFILGIIVIPFFLFIFIIYFKFKKNSKKLEELFKSIVFCSMYDFKHKVNEHEVATKNK